MTKILLFFVVLAMFVLSGIAIYESYRSTKENAGEEEIAEFEEVPQHETTIS